LKDIISNQSHERINILDYGGHEGKIRASQIQNSPEGLQFTLEHNDSKYEIRTPLIGEYNAQNILAAVSVAGIALGQNFQCVINGVQTLVGVPGRMERIDSGQDFLAIVDFAHTPNALKAALETCKKQTNNRVIAVFGSAGLRDREKRRMMAATSIRLADISIITAEDPRTESLDDILSEMGDEAKKCGGIEGSTYFLIADRGEAIMKAVQQANNGDIVIICGKGHEQSMCFGKTEYPWDDRIALKSALATLLDISGPDMPYLPTQENIQ